MGFISKTYKLHEDVIYHLLPLLIFMSNTN